MKHIVQFSGGKDSTCMLLMMLERGMPIDDIIFCDTTMEFPAMYEHIDKVEKYICRAFICSKFANSEKCRTTKKLDVVDMRKTFCGGM